MLVMKDFILIIVFNGEILSHNSGCFTCNLKISQNRENLKSGLFKIFF